LALIEELRSADAVPTLASLRWGLHFAMGEGCEDADIVGKMIHLLQALGVAKFDPALEPNTPAEDVVSCTQLCLGWPSSLLNSVLFHVSSPCTCLLARA
jgi:hypothetical protein